MTSKYDVKFDRLVTHNSVYSNYSSSFHDFVMDELELGARVAIALDAEDQTWWVLIGDPLLVAAQGAL